MLKPPLHAEPEARRRLRRVLFRVDASSSIGVGHLVRCLALAETLEERGVRSVISMARAQGDRHEWMELAGHQIVAPDTVGNESSGQFDWAVLDHYSVGHEWLDMVRAVASQRLVFDDLMDRSLPTEVIVNADPAARPDAYRALYRSVPRLLLGPRFVVLRRAFADVALVRRFGPVRQVLIALGGGRAHDAPSRALAAVREAAPSAQVVVVLGDGDTLRTEEAASGQVTVRHGLTADQMARAMADADLAVGGGGTSAWERCRMGLPSITVRLASNQDHVAHAVAAAGAAIDAGPVAELSAAALIRHVQRLAEDPERRRHMSESGQALVDGRGARRIANVMEGVWIREANWGDAELLWAWANDPVTRRNSLTREPISWRTHASWLRERLNDPASVLFVGETDAGPVGQVRFELGPRTAVSISIAPAMRGEGLGGLLLEAAIESFHRSHGARTLVAVIRSENTRSQRLFESCGFSLRAELGERTEYVRAAPGGTQ